MMKKLLALLTAALVLAVMLPLTASAETYPTPEGYNDNDYQKLVTFLEIENEDGVKNGVLAFGEGYAPDDPETWKTASYYDYIEEPVYSQEKGVSWTVIGGEQRVSLVYIGSTAVTGALDISGCTALEYLYCNNNNLTELDVTQNTALEYLICFNNNLTELDVTQNTALERIDCYNNALTELDVTQNTALEYLNCFNNNLTELDVTQNTALEVLYCRSCSLTELDVTQNTALEYLNCSENNLTELDVTQNTALRYLYCYENNLTELDVTQNTALERIDCYNNALTELDVTQNTALWILHCYENNLTELDVTQNTGLWSLNCSDNNLTELDVTKNTELSRLYCSDNNLTELDLTNQVYLYEIETGELKNIEFIWNATPYHVYADGHGYIDVDGYDDLFASAKPMDGCAFLGWYDAEGNLVSTEDYDMDLLSIEVTTLEARFEETDDPTDPTDPEGDISAEANEYGEVQYVHNEEDDSLTLNMTASDEAYGVRNIYINGVLVATTSDDTYVIDNISSYADENGNIEIYVEFAQSEGGEEPIDPDDPPKTGTASMVGMAIALMLIGAAIVLIRRRQTAR